MNENVTFCPDLAWKKHIENPTAQGLKQLDKLTPQEISDARCTKEKIAVFIDELMGFDRKIIKSQRFYGPFLQLLEFMRGNESYYALPVLGYEQLEEGLLLAVAGMVVVDEDECSPIVIVPRWRVATNDYDNKNISVYMNELQCLRPSIGSMVSALLKSANINGVLHENKIGAHIIKHLEKSHSHNGVLSVYRHRIGPMFMSVFQPSGSNETNWQDRLQNGWESQWNGLLYAGSAYSQLLEDSAESAAIMRNP